MFTFEDIKFRAGIKLQVGDETYVYSMGYFMRCFVDFSKREAEKCQKIDFGSPLIFQPIGSEAFFSYSQSITSGDRTLDEVDINRPSDSYMFPVNTRGILCPREMNCYMFDEELRAQYSEHFENRSISYLQMAKHLQTQMETYGIQDADVAELLLKLLFAGQMYDDNKFEVLSIITAALLLSEPKRNPCCFLPSLMLFELIAANARTPQGDTYRWRNCLQNEILVLQGRDAETFGLRVMADLQMGIGFNKNTEVTIDDDMRTTINAEKRYNKVRNQKRIKQSEFYMQLGGYFPMTHRFSYTELEVKRREGIPALSDIKSFILMTDWLTLKGVADPIHFVDLVRYLMIDSQRAILMEVVFPQLWTRFDEFARANRITFNNSVPQNLFRGYPSLLTKFGCRRKNMTPEKVANAFFLIHGSARYQEQYEELRLQFKFWCINHDRETDHERADDILRQMYTPHH